MIYWKVHSMKLELSKRCHTKILPSNELRKKLSYFPLYWLVYRDPYIWLIKIPIYLGRISSPIYNPTNQVFFFIAQICPQLHTTTPPPQTCTRPTSVDSKLFEKRKVKPFAGEEKLGPETRWFDCLVSLVVGNFGENLFHQGFQTGFSKKRVCAWKNQGEKANFNNSFAGEIITCPKILVGFSYSKFHPMWWI